MSNKLPMLFREFDFSYDIRHQNRQIIMHQSMIFLLIPFFRQNVEQTANVVP